LLFQLQLFYARRAALDAAMARLLRPLALAGLEATTVSLPLIVLTSIAPPWGLLFAVVLIGAVADALILRLPPRLDRPALLGASAAAALLLVSAGLGLGPLGALGALLPGAPEFGQAYLLLILALYLFWRGARVATRDSARIGAFFGRGAFVLLLALLLRPVIRPSVEPPAAALFAQVVAFISLGLLALALAHADEEGTGGRISWRWLLTLGLAIGGVILAGGLIAALLDGGAALTVAQAVAAAILLPFALVGAALAWVIFTLFAGPLAALGRILGQLFDQIPEAPQNAETGLDTAVNQGPADFITTLATSATWLMALIPLAILVVAILLLRRRRPPPRGDEERESLGLAENLAGDLRDLLARLRNPFARREVGLRAALGALAGQDPTSRVRRAYLRMLIGLEPRLPRPPAETPAEYAPAAGAAVAAPDPVAALTRAYERARYDPTGADPSAAAAAEEALAAFRQVAKPE